MNEPEDKILKLAIEATELREKLMLIEHRIKSEVQRLKLKRQGKSY